MTVPEPDRRPPEAGDRRPASMARRLARPPSTRYGEAGGATDEPAERRSPITSRPLGAATAIAIGGAVLLVVVGGILATTVGLLFIAAVTGAGVGLTLAGLAVPTPSGAAAAARPSARSMVQRAAITLAVGAVVVAAIATWLFARSEGGALGVVDYLWSTFGLLVPAEALLAAIGAAWGAGAGPVRRS